MYNTSMDYQKHYNLLMSKAMGRTPTGYVEKHHIIPKCLNGTNNEDNIVKLTSREHFIAHLLLAKTYGGKLWHAAHMMSNMKRYTSRKYHKVREEHGKVISMTQKGRYAPKGVDSPSFGFKHSSEAKDKMSKAKMGISTGKHTEETKAKMREARKKQTRTRDKPISVEGTIFASATKAANYLGITVSSLCKRMRSGKYPLYFYL
jgi:hypothetical protein